MEIIIQFIILGMTAFFVIFTGGSRTAFFGLLCCTALCFISARAWYRREKQLEELILYLMKLQDHPEIPELPKYSEGQIGVLQSEIYKLVVLISEQRSASDRKKRQLADLLSDISHQIKTPLASVTIMTESTFFFLHTSATPATDGMIFGFRYGRKGSAARKAA